MSVTNIHAAKTNLSKLIDGFARRGGLHRQIRRAARENRPVEPESAEFDRKALLGAWTGRAACPDWDDWKQMDAYIEASFRAAAKKDSR